eukprot:GILI01002613.1.p1 GENE.GILI01002613.1~~GILI01002613.1.p1  ORF type:complete len:489 (+),score=73.07 GILI01002613.1:182-1648(+)
MPAGFLPSVRKSSPSPVHDSYKKNPGSPTQLAEPLLMSIEPQNSMTKRVSPLTLSLNTPGNSTTDSTASDGCSTSGISNQSLKTNSMSTLCAIETPTGPYSCLNSSAPLLIPKYTLPADLLPLNKRRVTGGSPSDSLTPPSTLPSILPPIQQGTPPPPGSPTSNGKPLYHETCVSLFDFTKAIYGIIGPTVGASPSGRDVGMTSLTAAERLRNRRTLYKNISPIESTRVSSPNRPIASSPTRPRRLLLALDLDETLVHAFISLRAPLPASDALVEISTLMGSPPRKVVNAMYIKYRPHISEFMSVVAPLFDVVLFTAARPIYADTLMNVMDPRGSVIGAKSRYFRDSCTDVYNKFERSSPMPMSPKGSPKASDANNQDTNDTAVAAAVADEAGCEAVNGLPPLSEPGWVRVKDLAILGRPIEEIILIDNTPTCGMFQPRNLLPISSWFGTDTTDTGLLKVLPVLRKIAETRDVYGCLDEYCASMQPVM